MEEEDNNKGPLSLTKMTTRATSSTGESIFNHELKKGEDEQYLEKLSLSPSVPLSLLVALPPKGRVNAITAHGEIDCGPFVLF